MDIAFLTIAELNRAYERRELSPVEVTRALLDRVAAQDDRLNSFIRVTEDVAMEEARVAEAELMAGRRAARPMHGIPNGLKDIVETAGIPTTGHSKLRQHHVPKADAEIVRRLKAGGAVLLGKLATWEFALGGPSWDLPWPPARNPWERDRLPGGSSSGPGAGVAAGFMPAAIGTDTGGSVRVPAACCGIAGLKPTYGRVSRRGVFPNTFTMDHCGPMTRSAEDIALMLQVIAGYDAEDPGSEDCAVPDYPRRAGGRHRGHAARPRRGLARRRRRAPRSRPRHRRGGGGAGAARRHGRTRRTVEPQGLHRLQDDDLQRRAVFDPRVRSAHPAARISRAYPAQPGAARRADPRRGLPCGAALAHRAGRAGRRR